MKNKRCPRCGAINMGTDAQMETENSRLRDMLKRLLAYDYMSHRDQDILAHNVLRREARELLGETP